MALRYSIDDDGASFFKTFVGAVYRIEITPLEEDGSIAVNEQGSYHITCGTGFCIRSEGLLMSCAHILNYKNMKYEAITLNDDGTESRFEAHLLRFLRKWDISLFQLKSEITEFKFVSFADVDTQPCVYDYVYHIGGPTKLSFNYVIGWICFPCGGYDLDAINELWSDDSELPVDEEYLYVDDYLDALNEQFRVAETAMPGSGVHPKCPMITTVLTTIGGCSGGPLFNKRGEVIGLLIGGACISNWVPYALLKFFMDRVDEESPVQPALKKREERKKGKKGKKRHPLSKLTKRLLS